MGYAMRDLQGLVEKTVAQLNFELVDFEVSNRGKLLRVFIDKINPRDNKDSVTIDDCVLVSNQLGNILTVEHDVDYDRLEVSSAGLDRVLSKEKDFIRFTGERAQIKLRIGIKFDATKDGDVSQPRKSFLGLIKGVKDGYLLLECDGHTHQLLLDNIDKARLSPIF